jgi:hypothetical protein
VAVQSGEYREDFFDRCEHVCFGSAKGGQSCGSKARLEIAHVVMTELEVVDEVRSRTVMGRVGARYVGGSCCLSSQHCAAYNSDVCLERLKCVAFGGGGLHRLRLRRPGE